MKTERNYHGHYVVNIAHQTITSKKFEGDRLQDAISYAMKTFGSKALYGDEVTIEDSNGLIITKWRK